MVSEARNTYREILSVILSFAVKYGQAYPCQATIAKLACCSERTVANALQWLRIWGFLDWQRRLKRVPSRLGTITRQTSNAYRVALQGLAAIGAGVFSRGADATTAVHLHSPVSRRAFSLPQRTAPASRRHHLCPFSIRQRTRGQRLRASERKPRVLACPALAGMLAEIDARKRFPLHVDRSASYQLESALVFASGVRQAS